MADFLSQYVNDAYLPQDGGTGTPCSSHAGLYGPSTVQSFANDGTQLSPKSASAELTFLPYEDWDASAEIPPGHLVHTVEWKVTLNKRTIVKITELDVIVPPSSFFEHVVKSKLDKALKTKRLSQKRYHVESTDVVVSVTQSKVRDVSNSFDALDIDWAVIERQMKRWEGYVRAGKQIRVDLAFNYMEGGQNAVGPSRNEPRAQGASATQFMLGQRADQIDAENHSLGGPEHWRQAYRVMRCPGHLCKSSKWCWCDSTDQTHYPLEQHHLASLTRDMEQGLVLETHDDVPLYLRKQLYAEAQQRQNHGRHKGSGPSSKSADININVLHAQSPATADDRQDSSVSPNGSCSAGERRFCADIPGYRDAAVEDYCRWLESKVRSPRLKQEICKARDRTLEQGFTLHQVYRGNNPADFIENDVKPGIARQWVDDIPVWAEERSRDEVRHD
jgi:hypothetical protein